MIRWKQGAGFSLLAVALSLPTCIALAQAGVQAPPPAASKKPKTMEVFPPPPADKLKEIAKPELRAELLAMVSDDLIARSAST